MQNINEFMEDLLKEKGISIDDKETKEEVLADMAVKLTLEMNRAMIEALGEDKTEELAGKIDNMNDAEIAEFIQNAGVDTAKITEDAKNRFREFYLNGEAEDV